MNLPPSRFRQKRGGLSGRPLALTGLMFVVWGVALLTWLGQTWGETLDPDLLEARGLIQGGVLLDAARLYRRYLERQPEDLDARWEYAQLVHRLEQPLDAAYATVFILQRDPDHEGAQQILNFSLGQLEESMKSGEALGLLPELARLNRVAGDPEKAERLYLRYLEAYPEEFNALHELAQMYKDQGRDREALERLREAIALVPDSYDLRLKEALWLHYNPVEKEVAQEKLAALVEEFPDRYEGHLYLADQHRYAGRYPEARDGYRKAFALNPESEEAADGFAEVLLETRSVRRGKQALWAAEYPLAVALLSSHLVEMEEARKNLRELQGKANRDRNAQREMRYYRNFIDRAPPEAEVRNSLAEAFLQQERHNEAVEQMRWLVREDPENRDLRMRMARVLTYSNMTLADADAELTALVREDPEDEEAKTLLAEVRRYRGPQAHPVVPSAEAAEMGSRAPRVRQEKWKPAPEITGSAALIYDRSADYRHFWLEGRYQHYFTGAISLAEIAYRYLDFSQSRGHLNPEFDDMPTTIGGHQLLAGLGGNFNSAWSWKADGGLTFYSDLEDTWQGNLHILWQEQPNWWKVGLRKQEAVVEHYNLNALLAGVQTYDFYTEGQYWLPRSKELWYQNWGVHAALDAGFFSDDNFRARLVTRFLNKAIDNREWMFMYGIGSRIQGYDKRSPNYFSPGIYTGIGPTFHVEYRPGPVTQIGLLGSANYILEEDEIDFSFGLYYNHRITDATGLSLRMDYGESTFPGQSIQTLSGIISLRSNF